MLLRSMLALPLVLGLACATCARAQLPAAAPQLAAGDTWVYNRRNAFNDEFVATYRHRVAAIKDNSVWLEVVRQGDADGVNQTYTADWNWVAASLTNMQRFNFSPPLPAYVFPLEVGRHWQQDITATDPGTGKRFNVKVYGWVLGIERVKVPAGEFDAYKIRRGIYAGDFDLWKTQTRILEYDWYVPAVNGVVKHEDASEYNLTSGRGWPLIKGDRSRWELVSYTPGARKAASTPAQSPQGDRP